MKKTSKTFIAAAAVTLTLSVSLRAAEVNPARWLVDFEDKFEAAELNENYKWTRGVEDGFKVGDGALQIKVQKGTLDGDTNSAGNFLFFSPADGFQAAYTTLLDPSGIAAGQEAGLVLYGDDDNYVKAVVTKRDGKDVIVIVREFRGTAKEEVVMNEIPEGPIEVRMERDIFRLHFFVRAEGVKEWTEVGQARVAGKPPLWAGLYSAAAEGDGNFVTIKKIVALKPKPLDPSEIEVSPVSL